MRDAAAKAACCRENAVVANAAGPDFAQAGPSVCLSRSKTTPCRDHAHWQVTHADDRGAGKGSTIFCNSHAVASGFQFF